MMKNGFAFKWRVIEPWHEPDGSSMFSHAGNIFTWRDMLDPSPSSLLGRYVEQLQAWGYNGMALYADPETHPQAMHHFAAYLKQHGIGMIIRREWCEIEHGKSWPISQHSGDFRKSSKLCPYSHEVKNYWTKRIQRDFEMIPDLAAYRTNGTEFFFINGAPWMCDCAECRRRTPRERVRDAIGLLAGLLAEHNATLFWETCQDDPWGQRHERFYFDDLTGEIPPNAFIVMKRWYWDFHPGWPRHPLYDVIKKDAQGHSPYITTIQQPGEYTGMHDFPRCLVQDFVDAFRDMQATGQQGVWMMTEVHPEGWDHPLNEVNWYAVAQLIRNPQADATQLQRDWATAAYGAQVADAIVNVLEAVTRAACNVFEFDGLWTANHSRFSTLKYLDSHICGPLRQHKRTTGLLGLALPLDMYSNETAVKIRASKQSRAVYNLLPITAELKVEMLAAKKEAIDAMEEAIATWNKLQGRLPESHYGKILLYLQGNRDDAIVFYHGLNLFMDWKLGVITEKTLDAALDACRSLRGIVIPEPLDPNPPQRTIVEPATLATFVEELRSDLRNPWVESFWQEHSLGVSTADPIQWKIAKIP